MDKQYWRQRPAAELAPWVSDIIGYAENGIRLTGAIETASLVVPLVISFGAPFAIALGRPPAPTERFGSFTSGLFAGHVVIDSTGASACVQVNFTPLGAFRFFGVPVGELCGRMVPLEDMSDAGLGELRIRWRSLRVTPDSDVTRNSKNMANAGSSAAAGVVHSGDGFRREDRWRGSRHLVRG